MLRFVGDAFSWRLGCRCCVFIFANFARNSLQARLMWAVVLRVLEEPSWAAPERSFGQSGEWQGRTGVGGREAATPITANDKWHSVDV